MIRKTFLTSMLCTGAVALSLTAGGCRDGGSGDDTGDDAPDASTNPDDATIYDIQGSMPVGTQVNVRGVVVTAIDSYGMRKGNIFVQEPDGGAFSGVLVFGIDLGDVADLVVGDLIDLEYVVKDEFALTDDTTGRTTTELTPPDGGAIVVTRVGTMAVPAPAAVDALAIGLLPTVEERDAEWEKWEGVLITLENVSVLTALRDIGAPQDPPFQYFSMTGPVRADTSLAAINPVTRDECLASVTGIGDYFYQHKILPRSTDDVVTGGTGCPAPEADATLCADTIDNDADGFIDCADFSCSAVAACSTDTTVVMVQDGTVANGTVVNLNDVFVTAVDNIGSSRGFWVADALQGAAYNGVLVFTGATVPEGVVIGAVVDVTGEVDEFDLPATQGGEPEGDTLTEIDARNGVVTVVSPPGDLPVPLTGIAPNTLKDIGAAGEAYEGVLVQLSDVKVTMAPGFDTLVVTDNAGQTIVVDDDVYDYMAAMYPVTVTCFATLTGVMSLNIFDDERRLMPRQLSDMNIVGGNCN